MQAYKKLPPPGGKKAASIYLQTDHPPPHS